MEEKNYLRAHLRMDVTILLQYRELTPEECSSILQQSPHNNQEEETDEALSLQYFSLQPFIEGVEKEEGEKNIDPFIINALLDINMKLNLILTMLSGKGSTSIITQKPIEVNLSEGGIGFTSGEKLKEGTLLEIKMILPVFPISLIKVWGKVVRANLLPGGNYRIGIQYVKIKEEDQNKIVHYIFKKQREDLRTRKKGR